MNRSLEELRAWVTGQGRDPEPNLRPGVWVVGAGKGGVGTSTVTALLGLAARRRGSRTLVVEGVSGGLALILGQEGETAGIPDLARPGVEPEDLLVSLADGFDFLPAGRWADGSTDEENQRALLLRRAGDLYDAYDRVVVDGGSRATTVMAACSAGAERLWIVTHRNRVAAAGAYALVKALEAQLPGLPLALLANRATPEEGRRALSAIRSGCRRFLGSAPDEGPSLPTDPGLLQALDEGRSVLDIPPGPALQVVEQTLAPYLTPVSTHSTSPRSPLAGHTRPSRNLRPV